MNFFQLTLIFSLDQPEDIESAEQQQRFTAWIDSILEPAGDDYITSITGYIVSSMVKNAHRHVHMFQVRNHELKKGHDEGFARMCLTKVSKAFDGNGFFSSSQGFNSEYETRFPIVAGDWCR